MSREQNRRATSWSMDIVLPCCHQPTAVCLFTHSGPILFFRPRFCISKVWKCIFYARECSFWCIWVIWPAIIEFIIIKNVWIYHTWFSCEDNFSRVSEELNLGAGQCVVYAWIKAFQLHLGNKSGNSVLRCIRRQDKWPKGRMHGIPRMPESIFLMVEIWST